MGSTVSISILDYCRFHDKVVSYVWLSHSDERPMLVSPLLGIRLILEIAIAMRGSQTIVPEA